MVFVFSLSNRISEILYKRFFTFRSLKLLRYPQYYYRNQSMMYIKPPLLHFVFSKWYFVAVPVLWYSGGLGLIKEHSTVFLYIRNCFHNSFQAFLGISLLNFFYIVRPVYLPGSRMCTWILNHFVAATVLWWSGGLGQIKERSTVSSISQLFPHSF